MVSSWGAAFGQGQRWGLGNAFCNSRMDPNRKQERMEALVIPGEGEPFGYWYLWGKAGEVKVSHLPG